MLDYQSQIHYLINNGRTYESLTNAEKVELLEAMHPGSLAEICEDMRNESEDYMETEKEAFNERNDDLRRELK